MKRSASEIINNLEMRVARLERQSSHFQLDKNLKRELDRLLKGLLFSYEVLGLDWSYGESFGGPTLKVTWNEDSISQDGEDGWEEDWMDEGQIRNSDLLPLLDDIEDLVERSYPNSKVLDLQDSVRGQNHLIISLMANNMGKSAVNLRMNPAKKSEGIQDVVEALKDGSLEYHELSDFAVNTLRDHYRSLKEVRLKREYEEKVSQINPSADLGIALNWYAGKMRGEVAGSISFKKFMKLKNESGIPLNNGMKYYLYQALIANKTLRLP